MTALSIRNMRHTLIEREINAPSCPLTEEDHAEMLRHSIRVQQEWLSLYQQCDNEKAAASVKTLIDKLQEQLDALTPKQETHSKGLPHDKK